jgi:ribosome-associated protein
MIKESQHMAMVAVDAAESKKAFDVIVLDISDISIFTDYFVICSGSSTVQVKAIADEVDRRMNLKGYRLDHMEGYKGERWILMDYKDIIVHVFHVQEREFYNLERLWGDAKVFAHD